MRVLYALLLFSTIYVTAEKLSIHHLGIGQGDGTLVVAEHDDGTYTTILFDTGNSSGKGRVIFRYMEHLLQFKYKRLDYLVVSHLHTDHYGGAVALLELMEQNGWQVGLIVDKGTEPGNPGLRTMAGEDRCCQWDDDPYFANDPVHHSTRAAGSVLQEYLLKASQYPRKVIALGQDLFAMKNANTRMSALCVASEVKVPVRYGDNKTVVDKEHLAHSENDYSFGWLVQFDGFVYFSGGDLGGKDPAYLDLETPLVNYFKTWPNSSSFHCCALKASHHGSVHSTNKTFASFTRPTVAIIQSALRSFSGTQLPGEETIKVLENVGATIDYTYVPENLPWKGNVLEYKDVVLEVEDPGYSDIFLRMTTRTREKQGDLNWTGEPKKYFVECDKVHQPVARR